MQKTYIEFVNVRRGVKTLPHPKEEKKVEEKYNVVKEFTKYDYIVAHQKKYGWTSFKDSCSEFQEDMREWTQEYCIVQPGDMPSGYSDDFYKHGAMFGFLEKVEPEIIILTKAEIQSGLNRVRNAEGLISQLPKTHDGRNTWLLNYGTGQEAISLRRKRNLTFNDDTMACETTR